MPLVKPDEPPPAQDGPHPVDVMVAQKTENFWSMLRTTMSKLGGVRRIHTPKLMKALGHDVWKGQAETPWSPGRKVTGQVRPIWEYNERKRRKK